MTASGPARPTVQLVAPIECAPFVDEPGFILPLLLPERPSREPLRILHAGASAMLAARLAERWAPARVGTTARIGERPGLEPLDPSAEAIAASGPFDLALWGARGFGRDDRDATLAAAVASLAPEGVLIASFPSRLARAGLLAVAALLRVVLPHAEPERQTEVTVRLLNALPPGHHFRTRSEVVGEVLSAGSEVPRIVSRLEESDLSDVREVRERLAASGARWEGWLFPSSYDPEQCVADGPTARRLGALPEPTRSALCELIAAHPTVHHAVVRRGDGEPTPREIPTLERVPVRLPIHDWRGLAEARSDERALQPSPRTEFTGRVPLRVWQARLLLAADGARRGSELLAEPEVRRAFDLPKAEWEAETARFLERAAALRLIAFLPPAK